MSTTACIALVLTFALPAIAILVVAFAALRDLVRGSPVGNTLKSWLRRVADAFFSAA